jgi:hypothetical protein
MSTTFSYKHAFAVALNPAPSVVVPTVTTQAATSIWCTNFTANGNITATGGANAHTRGFCYMVGDSGDPTTANSTVYDNGGGSYGTGTYSKVVTSLACNTSYRVRAYAINSAGTGYGTSVTVTTGNPGISSSPDEYDFDTVAIAGTVQTAIDYFTITNTGNCTVDVTIQGTDLTGGDDTWDLSDTATPSENTYGMIASTGSSSLYENYVTGGDTTSSVYGDRWRAQTFTPSTNHTITSVQLLVYRIGSPGTVTVSITAVDGAGKPTGSDLAYGTTNGDTLTTNSGGEWRSTTFSMVATLTASSQYALVVKVLNGDASNYLVWLNDGSSPSYSGGQDVFTNTGGPPWSVVPTTDWMFKEYGVIFNIIVKETATYNYLVEDLTTSTTQTWGLALYMPSSLSGYDAQQMSGNITLVASAA